MIRTSAAGLLVIALAGCPASAQPPSSPARAPVANAPTPIDWAAVVDQPTAMAAWRRLDLRGSDDHVDEIPASVRRAMAYALIRDGRFVCPRRVVSCPSRTMAGEPAAHETFADPCVRQHALTILLHGLVEQPVDAEAAAPADIVAAIAGAGDADLISDLGRLLGPARRVDLLVAATAAGIHDADVWSELVYELPVEVRAIALQTFHIGEVVAQLEPADDAPLLLAAIDDPLLTPSVRVTAIAALLEAPAIPAELKPALRRAADDPDCHLAAVAAAALATQGERDRLPARPSTTAPDIFLRGLCVAAQHPDDTFDGLVPGYISAGGIEVSFPEGVPFAESTEPTRRHIDHTGEDMDYFDDVTYWMRFARCAGTSCQTEAGARLDLTLDLERGHLVLTRLVLHRDRAVEAKLQADEDVCGL